MPNKTLTADMIDKDLPKEVQDAITANPKTPEFDPTLRIFFTVPHSDLWMPYDLPAVWPN
jgi:hypothetical protein